MEKVVQELDLNYAGFAAGIEYSITQWEKLEETAQHAAKENPFKKQADDLLKFNNQLKNGDALFRKIQDNPKALKTEINNLTTALLKMATNQANAAKAGNWKQTRDEIKQVRAELDVLGKKYEETVAKQKKAQAGSSSGGSSILNSLAGKASGLLGTLGIGLGAAEVLGNIKDVTAEFQKYNAVLTNTLGSSSAAAEAMQLIQKFAAATPYSVAEVTESFVKLANQGFIPTEMELRQLADLAASTGKPFDQLVEAILDASTGEFERLKEFGIKARKSGDDIAFTFKGQTETVKNTESGIRSYILSLGDLTGVAGSTAAISGTLTGQLSNMGDAADTLYNKIGGKLAPVFTLLIGVATQALTDLASLFKTNKDVANDSLSAYENQVSSVTKLKNSIEPLLTRYDQLSEKARLVGGETKLSKGEQDELKKAINEVSSVIPSAITAQNQYGDVMSINTGIARDYIAEQERVAKVLNADSIEKYNKALALVQNRSRSLVQQLTQLQGATPSAPGQPAVSSPTNSGLGATGFRSGSIPEDRRVTMITKIRQELEAANEDAKNLQATIDYLSGKAAKPTSSINRPSAVAAITAPTSSELKAAAERETKLVEDRKKLEDELQKLEDDYDKQRLETLDKSSNAYLELKRKLDLKEIEQLRAHFIEAGQIATGYYMKNVKTGATTKVNNLGYKLPQSTEETLQRMRDATAPDYYENNTKRYTNLIKTDFTEKLETDELARQRKYGDMELELRNKLIDETDKLTKDSGESEVDYERRKAETLLQIKLDYYNKILALAEKDPFADQSAVTGFRETIQQIQGELKNVKAQGKTGPTNLFQLLGLTFKDENGNDITSEVEKQVGQAADLAISTANSVLSQQISADQARIDSIDNQLQAKQNEVNVELELQKQGLANNLTVKRQEYAALQAQRQKEVEAQRTAQKVQLAINATLQASELALAAAKIFKSYAGLPIVGQIAAIAEIAAMLIAFGSTVGQISTLPKYHDGDEVTVDTARSRVLSGNRRSDEIDARLQVGEGVIRKKSYQANKRLLRYLNTVDQPVALHDLTAYVQANPFGMQEINQQQGLQQITQYYELKGISSQPDYELHKRVDGLQNTMQSLLEETQKGRRVSRTVLPDGRVREVDENGNVTLVRHT